MMTSSMPVVLGKTEISQADRPYHPKGAAREIFRCGSTEVLLEGPAGTGKTRAALEKAHIMAEHYDGCRILFMRQTRESMSESVLVTWENKVIPEGHKILEGATRRMRQIYEYPNGSTVVTGGLDKPGKIMSTDFDLIVVFEATEVNEDAYETLTTRLRNGVIPYQQIIADCNPGASTHWLNQRANAGGMARLLSRHEDNPLLHDGDQWTGTGEAYLSRLDRLGGHRKERLRFGRWATAEGVVYSEFDRAVHVIDPFAIPDDWRIIRCVDFGYVNPFVCQWWAIDEDGRMYLIRELYKTERIVSDHARHILSLSSEKQYEATIADHDAEDRATLMAEGIETIAARKEIKPGIEAVQSRLRKQGDGSPRLYFFRDALVERDANLDDTSRPCSTIEEFDGYVWPRSQQGKPAKDLPVKTDDHGMDAMRYAVAYCDNLGSIPMEVRMITVGAGEDEHADDDIFWRE